MNRRLFLQSAAAAAVAAQAAPTPPAVTSSVMLWTYQGTFDQKLEIASGAGIQSVELVSEAAHWDAAEISRAKQLARSLHVRMDSILASENWKRRPVSMVRPEQRDAFLADVRDALVLADKLEVPQVILMSGDQVPGQTYEAQFACLTESAKRAADLAAKTSVTLIIEPLNSKVDHKDYFLSTCVDGLKLVKTVNNPHFRLLFDIYHEQVQIGNVIRTLTEAAPYVAVFHIADNPGRNDPGTGEMNYENIYKAIRSTGYSGYIAMEYVPKGDPLRSLTKSVRDMSSFFA
jgi:hydroxypyruvate isomerase